MDVTARETGRRLEGILLGTAEEVVPAGTFEAGEGSHRLGQCNEPWHRGDPLRVEMSYTAAGFEPDDQRRIVDEVEVLWRDRGFEVEDRTEAEDTIDLVAVHEGYRLRLFAHLHTGLISLGGSTPCFVPSDAGQQPLDRVDLGTSTGAA